MVEKADWLVLAPTYISMVLEARQMQFLNLNHSKNDFNFQHTSYQCITHFCREGSTLLEVMLIIARTMSYIDTTI